MNSSINLLILCCVFAVSWPMIPALHWEMCHYLLHSFILQCKSLLKKNKAQSLKWNITCQQTCVEVRELVLQLANLWLNWSLDSHFHCQLGEKKNREEGTALPVLVHVCVCLYVWAHLCCGGTNLWLSLFVSSTLYLAELSVRPSGAVEEVKPCSNTILRPSRSLPPLSK